MVLLAYSWSSDGQLLATGSRDGACKVWRVSGDMPSVSLECLHSFSPFGGVAVTALDIGPRIDNNAEVIAVGAESGEIQLWSIDGSSSKQLLSTPGEHCHGASVKKLSWRPDCVGVLISSFSSSSSSSSSRSAKLASCGEDNCVRIFTIIDE
jgi:WD40 repeat protein